MDFDESYLPPQYTALQLAARIARDKESEATVRQRINSAPLSQALRDDLASTLQDRDRFFFARNDALTREQQLLFLALLVRAPAVDDAWDFGAAYGFSERELTFLIERFVGDPFTDIEQFFDPSPELADAVLSVTRDLEMGIPDRELVSDLAPHLYAHDWDREALRRMREISGFETLLRKFSEYHTERLNLVDSEARRIRVTADQFPELHSIFEECCTRAGISRPPDFFVQTGGIGAYTSGVERPQIVISSALVSLLTPRELMFVIGHELGHVRSDHVLYQNFARYFPLMAEILADATLGFGRLLSSGVQIAVLDWYRKAEFTADRFGLLVCQDFDTAMRVLMKVAGAPPVFFDRMSADAFVEQGRRYHFEYDDAQNKFYKFLITAHMDHPWPSVRAWQLSEWVNDGTYEKLLLYEGETVSQKRLSGPTVTCARCKHANPDDFNFCESCGGRLHPEVLSAFCTNCGTELRSDERFCTECGTSR